jgi:hypothetical protein
VAALDQPRELLDMIIARFAQRRADFADIETAEPDAGPDEGDGVSAAPRAQVDERTVEAVEQTVADVPGPPRG